MLSIEDREEVKRLIAEATFDPGHNSAIGGALRIADISARTVEVFGDREKALRWLNSPVKALGRKTPLSVLGTDQGAMEVQDILGRVEHGVW